MQQTLFAILTNEQARTHEAIEENLNKTIILNAPWFSKVFIESFDAQQTTQK